MCEEDSSGSGGAEASQEVARGGDSLLCRIVAAGLARGKNLMSHIKNAMWNYHQVTINSWLELSVDVESKKCRWSKAYEASGGRLIPR